MIRRRDFLRIGAAAAVAPGWPLQGAAQGTGKVPRVVLVSNDNAPNEMVVGGYPSWSAFIGEMARLGFVEGSTVTYQRYRNSPGTSAADIADAIIRLAPDVIFWGGNNPAAAPAVRMNKTIPMVVEVADMLGQEIVTNLAHPGGNVTGMNQLPSVEINGKNVELLAQAIPSAKTLAYVTLGNRGQVAASAATLLPPVIAAASRLGLALTLIYFEEGGSDDELTRAFDAVVASKAEMVFWASIAVAADQLPMLAKLSLAARMPVFSPVQAFAEAGGLMSYGPDRLANFRQGADQVAAILNGANPGDLPVQQPTTFQLTINLKTAKAIRVAIPASLLAQATEVIQ